MIGHKMKYSLIKLSALVISSVIGTLYASAQQKPNIVLFIVDDMGWMDTSVPFADSTMERNRMFHTPNMKRLAEQGMKFTDAYTTPVCTPTRVSLMTGLNAAHHRITNWTSIERDKPSDGVHVASEGGVIKDGNPTPQKSVDNLIHPDWNYNGFSPVKGVPKTAFATPLPELLNDAGYCTIHIGKAHFAPAGTPGANPHNLGFMVNVAGHMAGMPQSYLGEENYGNMPGKASYYAVPDLSEYYGTETFLTEALTREALKLLDRAVKSEQPFFLYLSHYAVHLPATADSRFIQKYVDAGLDGGQAKYASMIEGMDKSLGDIMNYLERINLDKSTIVLFISDNGGISVSPEKGGRLHTHNLPLREGKGSVYEGGIRVPMIVKWPGVVMPGSKTDHIVIIEDLFPTLLELAGVERPVILQEPDGISLVPVLKGGAADNAERTFIWHYPHRWKAEELPSIDYMCAIRQGDWKLIYKMKVQTMELYNVKNDIGESNDLSRENPEKVKRLARLLGDKLRNWGALMPYYKDTGKAVPWPDEIGF